VPQLVLKCWGNSFFAFDKTTQKSFPISLKRAAAQMDFLTIENERGMEKILSDREAAFGKGIQAIVQNRTLDPVFFNEDLRMRAAIFIVMQWLRTPLYRKCLKQFDVNFMQALVKDEFKKDVKITLKDDENYFKARQIEEINDVDFVLGIAHLLYIRAWGLHINDLSSTRKSYWISDNPVSLYHPFENILGVGIGNFGTQILFPLAPDLLLSITEVPPYSQAQRSVTNVDEVVKSNRRQLESSERFLYCDRDNFEDARKFLQDYPVLANPNSDRVKVDILGIDERTFFRTMNVQYRIPDS
jgi:hypothetical protein